MPNHRAAVPVQSAHKIVRCFKVGGYNPQFHFRIQVPHNIPVKSDRPNRASAYLARYAASSRIRSGLAKERKGEVSFDHFIDDVVGTLEREYYVGEVRDTDRRELSRVAKETIRTYENGRLRNPLETGNTQDYEHCLNGVVAYYLAHIHPIGLTVDDGRRKYGSEEAFTEVLRKWRDENIRP
jgi:hypothetical protein